MKILVVGLATFEEMAGGSARYLSGMVAAFAAAGHDVEVVTGGSAVRAAGPIDRGIATQFRRVLRRLVFVQPRAIGAVIRRRPDVVNVHFAADGFGAVLAARLRRVPVVVTFHGPWAREALATGRRGSWPLSTRIRLWIERRVYRSAARCVVLSMAFRDLLHHDYGVPLERIRIVPAGIDTAAFGDLMDRHVARANAGLIDATTIVTVRRLVRRMGLDILLDAIASLANASSLRVVIAGIGPERQALEAQATSLGIADRVTFLGRVFENNLPAVYAAGDLCVVPTRELEGFGYVALEAYLAGTPVLATNVGGLVDVVGGFDADALVPPDAAALAAGITRALAGRRIDREACRAYASRFDWSKIRPRLEQVFGEAVARQDIA